MRMKSAIVSNAQQRIPETLPRGSGFLIAGALSLLMWGMIAGIVGIV